MNRWILMIGMLLGSLLTLPAQDVEVSAKVQDSNVAVGKPFSLDLTMKVPYGYYVEWNDFARDTLSGQIDILKRGEVVRTADADSNVIVQQELTLMTFDTGAVQVPSVDLLYARSADDPMRMKAYTDPVDLYVTTITVDTTQAFRPVVPPVAKPVSMKELFPWLLGLLLLVLAGIGLWLYLRRRQPKVDADGQPVKGPVIPPYNKAIGDLEQLRQQKLWQAGKVKEYYSGLSDIAREYIEGQFQVNAVEMTTNEILRDVRELHFDEQLYGKLKDTMELSDLVKFAKYSASSLENDNAMNDMTDFVNGSYAHYQAVKAQEALAEKEAPNHV
ncbi:MAG: hypothetical protein J5831_03435 [Bacteroidales bacterium]|nr:hypothetical protein [Bacteroidales bacterium]